MFRLTLLIIFAIVANTASLPALRIVGGSNANIKEAPYQVALLFDSTNSGIFAIVCGGSIISTRVVLSAAQCTYGSVASKWRIRAGSSTHSSGGQVIQVSSFRQHEEFNSRNMQNDIVALFLSNDIDFGFVAVPVKLPLYGLEFEDGSNSLVTGWGRTSPGGSIPNTLQKVIVQIVNQNVCESIYGGILAITDTMVCAGRFGVGGADACQGDTGGPLIISDVLYGITSWGIGCGDPLYPGVYTRVPMFTEWIDSNLQFATLDRISDVYESNSVTLYNNTFRRKIL